MLQEIDDVCTICGELLDRCSSDKIKYSQGYCKRHKNQAYKLGAIRGAEKRYTRYIERWKQGLETGMRGRTATSSHIRRYLFEKYNQSCKKCRWNKVHPVTQRVPLEINHIDGDFTNNKEENLELLCPNCHSLTSNYRSLNNGQGRPGR
jgi:hypothetical protein